MELEARHKKRILFAQPQIQEQIVEVVMVMLQELVPERVVEQIVDVPVLRSWKKSWRMLLVTSSATFEQATARVDVQAACESAGSLVFLVVISWCKRWNLEHVVLDLFSHIKTV